MELERWWRCEEEEDDDDDGTEWCDEDDDDDSGCAAVCDGVEEGAGWEGDPACVEEVLSEDDVLGDTTGDLEEVEGVAAVKEEEVVVAVVEEEEEEGGGREGTPCASDDCWS